MVKSVLPVYTDTSARQNYIGAEAAAFQNLMLPLFNLKGPGEIVKQQILTYSPQIFVTKAVVPTGIAGIAAGQIWGPNLSVNNEGGILQ